MYEDTPNKEEIDWVEERMKEIYDYERLKDCDIDYLYNQEFGARADLKVFESVFPHENSAIQGDMAAYILDDENADRESLTPGEKMRLQLLKKEIEVEVHRAFGHRKEKHREHRSRIANSITDAMTAIGNSINSLTPF